MSETLSAPSNRLGGEMPAQSKMTERFRDRLENFGKEAYSFVDKAAGEALAKADIKEVQHRLTELDSGFEGLLGRRSTDVLSIGLEDDIRLEAELRASRAGYATLEALPAEERRAVASAAAAAYAGNIIDELVASHPDWSTEELATAAQIKIADLATLLAMDASELDTYHAAMFDYQEASSQLPDLQNKVEELQDQRHQQITLLGGLAINLAVTGLKALRGAPYAMGAKFSTTVMGVGEWYRARTPEGKRALIFTAAGVALSGFAAYLALRWGADPAPSQPHLLLTDSSTDLVPDNIGAPTPPDYIGGSVAPDYIGNPVAPNAIGEPTAPDIIGAPAAPDKIGPPPVAPDIIGSPDGRDLSGAHTSAELFGTSPVETWPITITVSKWDSTTKDGSLWGISEQLLLRSGVTHATDTQIEQVVDVLRPQAGLADGKLRHGQTLDLRPALDMLKLHY